MSDQKAISTVNEEIASRVSFFFRKAQNGIKMVGGEARNSVKFVGGQVEDAFRGFGGQAQDAFKSVGGHLGNVEFNTGKSIGKGLGVGLLDIPEFESVVGLTGSVLNKADHNVLEITTGIVSIIYLLNLLTAYALISETAAAKMISQKKERIYALGLILSVVCLLCLEWKGFGLRRYVGAATDSLLIKTEQFGKDLFERVFMIGRKLANFIWKSLMFGYLMGAKLGKDFFGIFGYVLMMAGKFTNFIWKSFRNFFG